MRAVKPDWKLAFRVWWAFCWRALSFSIIFGFIAGLIVGIVGVAIGLEQDDASRHGSYLGGVTGIVVSCWVIKRMMTKGFGKYCLVVAHKDSVI